MLMKKEVIDENQRLKEALDKLTQENTELEEKLQQEKDAYNRIYNRYVEKDNIINELEEWLKENNERLHKAIGRKCVTQESYEEVLDKIKELKGSDKE